LITYGDLVEAASQLIDRDHRVGKGLWGFVRRIVPDAAVNSRWAYLPEDFLA
jgi:hypothetical protein